MNKYQKIALAVGIILLVLIFGRTITQIGFRAIGSIMALMGKFVIVIIAILLLLYFLKKFEKKK